MRIYIPLALSVIFLGWFFYRLLITKDIRKNRNEALFGFFFIGIWYLIYHFIFS